MHRLQVQGKRRPACGASVAVICGSAGELSREILHTATITARRRLIHLAEVGSDDGLTGLPLPPAWRLGRVLQRPAEGPRQEPLATARAGQPSSRMNENIPSASASRNSSAPYVAAVSVSASSPAAVSMAPSQPVTTQSRNPMCPSISRNDGHALDAEKDKAKITASPVSKVAKNAMLNVTESMTSSRASGTA